MALLPPIGPVSRRRSGAAVRLGFALAFLSAIVVASLLPQPWKGLTALPGLLHDGAHILAFALALRLLCRSRPNWVELTLAAAGLLVFGATLEWLQTAQFGSRLEYRDILDDAIGIAAAAVSFKFTDTD